MSINLVAVDLTSASVGTTGKVLLPLPVVQVDELAHLRVYNESGCGLTILFDNGHQEVIPAGAWPMFEIEPQVKFYTWTVSYVLPNAPVALVSAVYYFPYEGVPPTPALGNSPIGVTGGVTTSSIQTLSNETNPTNTQVIDIGDVVFANLWRIWSDHFVINVDQSSVKHQVLAGNAAGSPLQLGQAGDTTEVLGQLLVDQQLQPANAAISSVVGSIAGTATFYAAIWGASLKIGIIVLAGYNSANALSFTLPTALSRGWIFVGNQGGGAVISHFERNAVSVSVRILTGLAVGGGTTTTQVNMSQDSLAQIISSVDTWKMAATGGATDTAIIMIGQ